jgi:hypothetical protein
VNAQSHHRSIVVWDVPNAVGRGETFAVAVGLKCSEGCEPDTWLIGICDHEGRLLASRRVGLEPWPGTTRLYHVRAELAAPDVEGLFAFEAFAPAIETDDDTECAHAEARASFNVRVVTAPECRLTVIALDRHSKKPIEGAKVVVHPYRASTDERGIAELRVPKGAFRLFVSGRKHCTFRYDGDVAGDATVTAELEADAEPSDAELWS